MKTFRLFCLVVLAVLLANLFGSTVTEYSQTHLLLQFRSIKMAETGRDSGAVQVYVDRLSPFHQAKGVHVYMISVLREKDGEGFWKTVPGEDTSIKEGLDFIAFKSESEDHLLTWMIVCSTEKLTTWKEVEAAGWNPYMKNSLWFEAAVLPAASLECK